MNDTIIFRVQNYAQARLIRELLRSFGYWSMIVTNKDKTMFVEAHKKIWT